MMYASLKQAIANPKAKILNCSLNISHKYIRTYYARMYEAKFLTGVLAGALATQNRLAMLHSILFMVQLLILMHLHLERSLLIQEPEFT